MVFIFFLSHQPATQSSNLSSGITQLIINTIEKIAPGISFNWDLFHHFIRKNAHFFIYFVLGILVSNAFITSASSHLTKGQILGYSIGLCILYAISDEVHQVFIPGRAGQIKDVIIDSAGAVIGVLLYWTLRFVRIK